MADESECAQGCRVVLAGVSTNGSLNFWWQQDGATGWNHQQVAAG